MRNIAIAWILIVFVGIIVLVNIRYRRRLSGLTPGEMEDEKRYQDNEAGFW